MARLYSRTTVKKIVKAHNPRSSLSKNVDVMIYLDYLLFLQRLAREADAELLQTKGTMLQAHHLQKVVEQTLQQFRG
ncbi:hypothetical protein INT43_001016 [Umbelopsis isabellina]|uniref:Transcription factor CBF/NF-Y/archaeal histone domain-containing protein n=1 Tax=Mortierella isabellina TaxID=91625 RepID=A0A8H7PKY4_MORIS|nr:hypothetical protein INT43_001016 [Umbelopsis isabellina]